MKVGDFYPLVPRFLLFPDSDPEPRRQADGQAGADKQTYAGLSSHLKKSQLRMEKGQRWKQKYQCVCRK